MSTIVTKINITIKKIYIIKDIATSNLSIKETNIGELHCMAFLFIFNYEFELYNL